MPLRRPVLSWEEDQWNCVLGALKCIKIRTSIPDSVAWTFCPKCAFSVQSFRRALEDNDQVSSSSPTPIWNNFCPPKIEIFVWNLLKERVLVHEVMIRFGLTLNSNSACSLCNNQLESIDHLFLHCKWSWNLWVEGMSWWNVSTCPNLKLLSWWDFWRSMSPGSKYLRAWVTLFYAIVWTIWETRNARIFEKKVISQDQASDLVRFRVGWWFKHHRGGSQDPITSILLNIRDRCVDSKKTKTIRREGWIPPGIEDLKFNVDGSSRGKPGMAGIGGVLRDHNGKIMCIFSNFIGVEESNTAEILAIHRAMELCASRAELLGRKIVIASDSTVAVSWVNKSEDLGSFKHIDTIYDIKTYLKDWGNCSVEFNYRNSNSFADSLAKMGSSRQGDFLQWGDL